jgi:hypothetical protein
MTRIGSDRLPSPRPRQRPHVGVFAALLACAMPTVVVAQERPAAPRPAFENLRYREDWSSKPSGDAWDALKHVDLDAAGRHWISFGGHLRVRGESVRNFLGGGPGTRRDAFLVGRAHLHADLHVGSHVRGFVEGRVADVAGRELPGGARAIDRDRLDLGNAFLEARGSAQGMLVIARVGRQELQLGRERILSPLDWANVRRIFEGASAEVRRGSVAVTAFAVHPLQILPEARDVALDGVSLLGSEVSWRAPTSGRVLEAALLVRSTDAVGAVAGAERSTLAARLLTPVGRRELVLEVEGGVQRASGTGRATFATMLATDLTLSPRWRGAPAITLGIDRASGTPAGAPAQSETWDQLYPLAHAYAGFADMLGRRNLLEERLVVQFSPRPPVRARVAFHAFQRVSDADAAYDVAGAVFRSALPGSARDVGKEVDLSIQWRLSRHLRADGGIARVSAGRFLRETGSALPYTWGFASLVATF